MKFYEFPPTRSIRARWTLQELGVDFEGIIIDLTVGAHQDPSFLAINPAGKLPVLADGETVVTESIAIVLYLCEKFREPALLPSDLVERAQVYRWLMFTVTELEQPLWRIARHTLLYPEQDRSPKDIDLARRDFVDMARVLEAHLEGRQFIVGDGFTAADIVCAYTLDWANEVQLLEQFPAARRYMERHYLRPSAPPRLRDAFASVDAGR